MYLKHLELQNFRNYSELSLDFSNRVNVILGENAQGKTNLMEAVFVLAMTRSHRTSNDKELIQWDKDYATIKGSVEKKNTVLPLELVITKKGKRAKCNYLDQERLSRYIGNVNVVMFAPEDLNLVRGGPMLRRRFIDMEIGQVSPVYLQIVSQYNKVLQQRNHYLKQLQGKIRNDWTVLDIYTEQLIDLAVRIVRKRFEFLHLLEIFAKDIHSSISREREFLSIQYKPSVDVSEDDEMSKMKDKMEENFRKVREREIERGITLLGPQRDDILFFVNEKNVQIFGSQGQKRTTALSLKLAELELIYREIGDYPILLLDDVLSELDDHRQSHLLNAIRGKVQTFVTTTSDSGIDHHTLKEADLFIVKKGMVEPAR
jgi:DNA replication and repair protein RecF